MTDKERKALEARRKALVNERAVYMAKANQAVGGIALLDEVLALPTEAPPELPPANSNGHDAEAQPNG